MESRRTRTKANQHHQDSDEGLMTSMVLKTFVASREPIQLSESTSPIPHTSRLSFSQMSAPKIRRATTYINLVCEAIEAIGNHLEITERFFKTSIKNALLQGLEEGTLARPAKSKLATGAVGSFYVAKKPDKNKKTGKATKVKAAGQPVEYTSDTDLTINRGHAMSVRFNQSDTELAEVMKSMAFETKPKMRGGRSVKVAEESSSEDSENEEQIKPVVKAKTKKVIKESKAPKKTAPTKPTKKAASSKTKDEKENAPPTHKQSSRNKKNAKKNWTTY